MEGRPKVGLKLVSGGKGKAGDVIADSLPSLLLYDKLRLSAP